MAKLMPPPANLTTWLQPGDALLYRSKGLMPWLIMTKTWSRTSHISVYMGKGISYAARTAGVRSYPLRVEGLYAVLRPEGVFDQAKATAWFNAHAVGQRYDTWGLFRFFTLGKQSQDKQFCSELAVRLYRAAKCCPFGERYDADLVSPGMFLSSPHFRELWFAEYGN
jgi:hypothetical protein